MEDDDFDIDDYLAMEEEIKLEEYVSNNDCNSGFASDISKNEKEGNSSPLKELNRINTKRSPNRLVNLILDSTPASVNPLHFDNVNEQIGSQPVQHQTIHSIVAYAHRSCDEQYFKIKASEYLSNRPLENSTEHETCVLSDGSRRYIRRRPRHDGNSIIDRNGRRTAQSAQLLEKPLVDVLEEALSIQGARESRSLAHDAGVSYDGVEESKQCDITTQTKLWVDKYSPSVFTQLLSPERINREMLKALKAWDPFVFKKGLSGNATSPGKVYKRSEISSGNGNGDVDDVEPKDDDGDEDRTARQQKRRMSTAGSTHDLRPEQKVILLCGPPGTGKTTLAHVLARHCGYRPIEVNSSDDRSADAIREVLLRGTQSRTLNGDSRPNCVILDEIDGVDGKAPIDMLISIINTPLQQKGVTSSKRKAKGSFALTRPLICICNDQFVPSLRELRKLAHIFVMGPPVDSRLIQRLRTVCTSEGISMSPAPLSALVQATSGDIRSCINTLQFAAQKSMSLRTSSELSTTRSAAVSCALWTMIGSGLKDDQKDIFQIWGEILCKKEATAMMHKRKVQERAASTEMGTTTNALGSKSTKSGALEHCSSVNQVAHIIAEYGDDQLVMAGVFENAFKVRYSDPTFLKTQHAAEWMSIANAVDGFARTTDNGYQVMAYVPWTLGAVHLTIAGDARANLQYPSKDRDVSLRRQQRLGILHSLVEGDGSSAGPRSAALASTQVVAVDSAGALVDLITPLVRSIPLLSMSALEKGCIAATVSVLAACCLHFVSVNVAEPEPGSTAYSGQSILQLEPAVDQLVRYPTPPPLAQSAVTRGGVGRGVTEEDNTEFFRRRPLLSAEVRYILNSELVRFAITSKAAAADGNEGHPMVVASTTTKPSTTHSSPAVVEAPAPASTSTGVSTSTSGSVGNSASVRAPSAISGIAAGKGAFNGDLRARTGRMDFFCAKPVGAGAGSTATKRKVDSGAVDESKLKAEDVGSAVGSKSKKPRVSFKFSQGFSNAVRRPVTIEEFL